MTDCSTSKVGVNENGKRERECEIPGEFLLGTLNDMQMYLFASGPRAPQTFNYEGKPTLGPDHPINLFAIEDQDEDNIILGEGDDTFTREDSDENDSAFERFSWALIATVCSPYVSLAIEQKCNRNACTFRTSIDASWDDPNCKGYEYSFIEGCEYNGDWNPPLMIIVQFSNIEHTRVNWANVMEIEIKDVAEIKRSTTNKFANLLIHKGRSNDITALVATAINDSLNESNVVRNYCAAIFTRGIIVPQQLNRTIVRGFGDEGAGILQSIAYLGNYVDLPAQRQVFSPRTKRVKCDQLTEWINNKKIDEEFLDFFVALIG
jgi:hypothetical protein